MDEPVDTQSNQSRQFDRAAAEAQRRAREGWVFLRPRLWQTLVNLRIWVPVLSNRGLEARLVRLWARECRSGLSWEYDLPKQCWRCGSQDELIGRQLRRDVRSFESPLVLVACAAAVMILCMLCAWLLGSWLAMLLALATIPAGYALILLRSWNENVSLSTWRCREHEAEPCVPDMAVDQGELFLYLPSAKLAEAANRELADKRRNTKAERGAMHDTLPHPSAPSSDAPDKTAPSRPEPGKIFGERPSKPDLPPIKLVGEDWEEEASSDADRREAQ